METILSIDDSEYSGGYEGMTGLVVTTNKQVIKIGISSHQSCCEYFGSFSTNDDIQDFVGANILSIRLTDTDRSTIEIPEGFKDLDADDIMFVDVNTDKGTLQYAVYNSHNGYYGHSVEVVSEQFKYESSL